MATYNPDDYEIVEDAPQQPEMTNAEILKQRALRGLQAPISAAAGPGMGFATAATGFAPLAMGTPAAAPTATEVTTATEKARQALGATTAPLPQRGLMMDIAGGMLEEGLNPYNYIIPGGSRIATVLTPAATAAASEVGGSVGKSMTGTETGRTVGSLIGGLINPAVLAEAGLNQITAARTLNPDKINTLVKEFGDQKAAAMIAAAYTSDPDLKAKLLRAAELTASTGVNIPLLQAADNNVLTQTARSLSARDLKFQAAYAQLEQEAAAQLAQRQSKIFGSVSEAKMANALGAPTKVAPKLEQRIKSVQEELADAALSFERSEFQEIGNKLRNLVTARETQVRKELGKKYESVITAAEEKGYKVSSAETGDLYDFVKTQEMADIFKTFPKLNGQIKRVFAPTETGPSTLVDPNTGRPFFEGGRDFPEASMRDLDSLKRAVNESLRNAGDAQVPALLELKAKVNGIINNMPGNLGDAYRAVDQEFYSKIGVPFGAKSVQDVKYKDFVEQTIPAITKNRSALTDYLGSVGREDGLSLARDAFFADATRYGVVKDGVLDPQKLKRYIEVHKDTLSAVPEIRQELQSIAGDGLELTSTIAKLNELKRVQDTQASAKLFERFSTSGLDGVAAQFLTSPDFRRQFLSPGGAGRNKAAIDSLRAKMTDSALNATNPLEYLTQNREAYDQLFGKSYGKALNDLVEVADRLNTKLFINTPLKTIQRTGLEEVAGVSPAGLVSVLRDRVAGTTYKAINLLSKFYVNQVDNVTKEELGRFLTDPEAVRNVSAALKKLDGLDLSGASERANKLAKDLMGGIAHTLVRRGVVVGGVATEQQPEPAQPAPTFDPTQYEILE